MNAMNATRAPLGDGRWHLQHGPIDVIVGADGDARAVQAAHEACWQRFTTVLVELVAELRGLREPVHDACPFEGVVARRMWHACHAYRAVFITPMAAVAGSVADELIAAYSIDGITRAFVNNGGDIALWLTPGEQYRIGVFADLAQLGRPSQAARAALPAHVTLDAAMAVRGVATSGWRGRSFSLGIADSVTVLARTAADADAAATIVANAVDVDHEGIVRASAASLRDDTDLGERLVTVEVPRLPAPLVELALERGAAVAQRLVAQGVIDGAGLFLQGQTRTVGAACLQAASYPQRLEATCSNYAAC